MVSKFTTEIHAEHIWTAFYIQPERIPVIHRPENLSQYKQSSWLALESVVSIHHLYHASVVIELSNFNGETYNIISSG